MIPLVTMDAGLSAAVRTALTRPVERIETGKALERLPADNREVTLFDARLPAPVLDETLRTARASGTPVLLGEHGGDSPLTVERPLRPETLRNTVETAVLVERYEDAVRALYRSARTPTDSRVRPASLRRRADERLAALRKRDRSVFSLVSLNGKEVNF